MNTFKVAPLLAGLSLLAASSCSPSAVTSASSTTSAQKDLSTLTIASSSTSILEGASALFVASGGTSPYTFSIVSGTGTIGSTTGIYVAPAASGAMEIQATDAAGAIAYTSVYVAATTASSIVPNTTSATVAPSATFTFSATGGTAPYSYTLSQGTGTIDAATGIYTAPSTVTTDVIKITDALGSSTYANAIVALTWVPIYRFYKNSDHFYSQSSTEGTSAGMAAEGHPFKLMSAGSGDSTTIPLYRCRMTVSGNHFISGDTNCEGQTVDAKKVLGYSYTTQTTGTVPLYRFVAPNGKDHLETLNSSEGINAGYYYQGYLGYVMAD
jgi:hypothetical protein